jgi:NAD(P)-dependent dehydrogenase (short-subunit alcohol dehydrogenase family)
MSGVVSGPRLVGATLLHRDSWRADSQLAGVVKPAESIGCAPSALGVERSRLMSDRAAIVTGASRGIGLAIAEALAENGYGLTATARKPEPLEQTAEALRGKGFEVEHLAANMADEADIRSVVARHRERFGRLDVLVNNAGVGFGAAVADQRTKNVDLQVDVNLRAIILFYRECADMLRAAGAEHGKALVVNLSSFAGKSGQPWLSVYSATKAGVVGYTQAMNKELNSDGVKSVVLCPAFVDTDMSEFIKESVDAAEMIRPNDIAEAVLFVLRLSPACVVPEIIFQRPGETL